MWDWKEDKPKRKPRYRRRKGESLLSILLSRSSFFNPTTRWPDPAAWGEDEEQEEQKVPWWIRIFKRKK